MLNLGIIGYGGRASGVISEILKTGEVRIAAITDIRNDEIKEKLDAEGYTDIRYYTDADMMIKSEKLDGVFVGTRCSMHTHFALLVAKYGLPLFLEKPVSTTDEDLLRLEGILPEMNEKTVVSFPLRLTTLCRKVKEIVASGKLGRIEHIQAYNNVSYGRGYFHKWYREESETGGQFLQKATHDLDYINDLLDGNKPVRICAMKSQQIFGGDEPSGKRCAECEKTDICPESPKNLLRNGDGARGDFCCFAKDVTIEDSGSCILEYESGMHVVYSQDFIVRKDAGKRGARLIGFYGTLEFDWVSGKITVYHHQEDVKEEYTVGMGIGHYGGDVMLADNFIGVMKGKEKSLTPLADGILSAKLCLAAKKSSEEHIFVDIK